MFTITELETLYAILTNLKPHFQRPKPPYDAENAHHLAKIEYAQQLTADAIEERLAAIKRAKKRNAKKRSRQRNDPTTKLKATDAG